MEWKIANSDGLDSTVSSALAMRIEVLGPRVFLLWPLS